MMRFPDHLREAFHEALYACIDGDEAELSVYWHSEYDQRPWLAMDAEERLMWIAEKLSECTDILPSDTCTDLDIPQGSTYRQACMKILQGEVTLSESV
jgi:hypothetical protein